MSKITESIEIQNFIKDNYLEMTDRELSKILDVPKSTIQNYRNKNNLIKVKMGLPSFERKPFEILVETEYKNYSITNYGRLVNTENNYVINSRIKQGYYRFRMKVNGKYKDLLKHRLIAKAFIPQNIKNKTFINHRDGNKLNNDIMNLEWCTIGENNTHAHKSGLVNYDKTITKEEAKYIISMINEGHNKDYILSKVPKATDSIYYHIKSKRRWKSLQSLMKW